MNAFRKAILAAACVGSLVAVAAPALAQTTLRAVMHSDLKILDPIWTTAYIVRNHGYMIYDTLLAQDEKGEIKPQMVEKYEASADGKSYTFTLRDGLLWHDGKPVTSEDCIASIKRWAAKDSLGQKMMTFVDSIDAVDAKTFTIKLKEPTGLVLLGLSKPSSNVPFMMPKRVAETDPNKQIEDFTGSGPVRLRQGRMEARRQDRLRQVRQVQAALRAGVRPGRRQGRQGRPRRVARHLRRAAGGQRAVQGRDRLRRAAEPRSARHAEEGSEHRRHHLAAAEGAVRLPSQPPAQAVRQSEDPPGAVVRLQPGRLPDGDHRRRELHQGVQGAVHLRHAVRLDQGHGRTSDLQHQEGAGAAEGSRLRRHARAC